MAPDYDAPRTRDTDEPDNLGALKTPQPEDGAKLGDELDPLDVELLLPSADLVADDAAVHVLPPAPDEFTCSRCYLVRHRSQLADKAAHICADCAA